MTISRTVILLCLLLAILVIGVPSYLYINQFSAGTLSTDQAVWGEFGDFMNVWVAIGNLIALGGLTFYISTLERSQHEASTNLENARSRPTLIYKYLDDQKKWVIQNVGNGPALNIRLSFLKERNWEIPNKIHSLISGGITSFPIRQPTSEDVICLVYYDIHGTVITTLGQNEDSEIILNENYLRLCS